MAISIINSDKTEAISYLKGSLAFEDTINQRGTVQFQFQGSEPPLNIGEDLFLRDTAAGDDFFSFVGGEIFAFVGGDPFLFEGGTVFWGGTVEGYDETDVTVGSATHLLFSYRCVDFDQIASKRLVQRTFTNVTSGAIVIELLSAPLGAEGITQGTVELGAVIESISFNWVPADFVLDEIAELSGFAWWIDEDKKLHFRSRNSITASFSITDSNQDYRGITFSRSRTQLRTVQYIRAGSEIGDERSETQFGDGFKRAFLAELAVGETPVIAVDTGGGFSNKTVGVAGVKIDTEWVYNLNSKVFSQNTTETVLSATDKVKITYKPRFPLIVSIVNSDLETDRASIESGTGRYENIFDALDIDTRAEAINKARSLLARFGNLQETVIYTTDTRGLKAGTLQRITLAAHGIDTDYLITKVTGVVGDDGLFVYRVAASANQAYGGWTHHFKQKTRQDRKFVIRENETILNLRDVPDSVSMQDDPGVTTTTVSGFTVGSATAIIGLVDVG